MASATHRRWNCFECGYKSTEDASRCGTAPIAAHECNDLLELLDDRVGTRSTLVTSQLPLTAWHAWMDAPTLADAILDRIVHGSHKMPLKGESMRKVAREA